MKTLEAEFKRLSKQWKEETKLLSNVNTIVMHPAYQRIVALGTPVLPLIFNDLKKHPGTHWYWALTTLTGENPITPEIAGKMQEMANVWLKLGKEKGWLREEKT